MDELHIEISPIKKSDIDNIADLLANAFLEEPGVVAVVRGTPEKRLKILRRHYATYVEMNLCQGVSRVGVLNGKIVGVMQISAPGKETVSGFDLIRLLCRSVLYVSPAIIYRALKSSLDDGNHRPAEPNYYLETLGVEPNLKGRGIGSMMLSYLTNLCDGEGVLGYLSTTEPLALPLYERFGFRIISETDQFGTPNYHMVRKPKRN